MTRATRSLARATRNTPTLVWETWCTPNERRRNSVVGGLLQRLGISRRKWLASPNLWLDLVHRDDRTAIESRLRAMPSGQQERVEFRWLTRDGEVLWVEAHFSVVRTKRGGLVLVRAIAYDVSRQKETERALRESIACRDKFLTMLVHELRAPIGAITGWASMMVERPDDLHRASQGLAAILRNSQLQSRLIEDVLDLSRGLLGKLSISREAVSISAVLAAAHEAVLPSASMKKVGLKCTMAEGLPAVIGDEGRLVQALSNLLANAVKFTPPGGRISVAASSCAGGIEVAVTDSGIGMQESELSRIFEPFFQVRAGSPRASGLGLGLTLVKDIVQAHGGTVSVESVGPGRGSRFAMRLPCLVHKGQVRYRAPLESGDEEVAEEPDRRASKPFLSLSA